MQAEQRPTFRVIGGRKKEVGSKKVREKKYYCSRFTSNMRIIKRIFLIDPKRSENKNQADQTFEILFSGSMYNSEVYGYMAESVISKQGQEGYLRI